MASTWLFNAGQPCCKIPDFPDCGTYCKSCGVDAHLSLGGAFLGWSLTGEISDDNVIAPLNFSVDRKFWYTDPIVYETDALGEYSPTGVWNWDAVRGGAEPKYKVVSGQTMYRYVVVCDVVRDGGADVSAFRLGAFWVEGTAYDSQEEADSSTNKRKVFVDASRIVVGGLLPLPPSYVGDAESRGVEWTDGTGGSACGESLSPIFSGDVGPEAESGFISSPSPISSTASVFIEKKTDYDICCNMYCGNCDNHLLTYGSLSDDNGSFFLAASSPTAPDSTTSSYAAPASFLTNDKFIRFGPNQELLRTTDTFQYGYDFVCDYYNGTYVLWSSFYQSGFAFDDFDSLGFADSSLNGPGGDAAWPITIRSEQAAGTSCNPLSVTFDLTNGGTFATQPEWNDDFLVAGSTPVYVAFPTYRPPASSVTVRIGAYNAPGRVFCVRTLDGIIHPVPRKPLTLSATRSGGGWTETLIVGDHLWAGTECHETALNVPTGYSDAGEPARIRFDFDLTLGLRIRISKQATCESNFIPSLAAYVPLDKKGGARNSVVDYSVDPFYLSWSPSVAATGISVASLAVRQFLIDAGYTRFVLTE